MEFTKKTREFHMAVQFGYTFFLQFRPKIAFQICRGEGGDPCFQLGQLSKALQKNIIEYN